MSEPTRQAQGRAADTVTRAQAQIFGGVTVTVEPAASSRAVGLLNQAGEDLAALRVDWETIADHAAFTVASALHCSLLPFHPADPEHDQTAWLRLGRAGTEAREAARKLSVAAADLTALADLLARATSLYSAAESSLYTQLTGLTSAMSLCLPGLDLLAAGLLMGAAWQAGGGNERAADLLNQADSSEEAIFSGLGQQLIGQTIPGLSPTAPVNQAAENLSWVSAPLEALIFGDRLTVTEAHPTGSPVGASQTIDEALGNLDRLTAPGSGVAYGTVAVQQYRGPDGSTRWLVLIPGTDTHADTAIGWGQNIELMSADNQQRMHADSSRLVLAAMRRSGIKPDEPVSLIGHSQGGIVAAAVAVGAAKDYNITHIVTAGSPIAGHPVPATTWVTSVENKGELVSNLDGARNPQRPTWLTVRGTIIPPAPAETSAPQTSPAAATAKAGPAAPPAVSRPSGTASAAATTDEDSNSIKGTPVVGAPGRTDITHALNYQRATWEDAESFNSPAVKEHDEHFSQAIAGSLEQTRYFTGRMSR